MDFRLQHPGIICLAGPTMSGKSYFTRLLVSQKDIIFSPVPNRIFWFSSFLPDPVERMANVTYLQGLPDEFDMLETNCIVVLDDLMVEARNSKAVTNLYTKGVHHLKYTLIMITQNAFYKGGDTKTRNINTTYLVLFKNSRDKTQINYIARQMYPKTTEVLTKAFDEATDEKTYSYLFLDLHPAMREAYRLRINVLPHELPMMSFVPNEQSYKLLPNEQL